MTSAYPKTLERIVGAQACPFDKPFDKLRVPSGVEGLRAPSLSRGCAHFGRRDQPSPERFRRRQGYGGQDGTAGSAPPA